MLFIQTVLTRTVQYCCLFVLFKEKSERAETLLQVFCNSCHKSQETSVLDGSTDRFSMSMEISRLTRDGTAEPVSRDQILRHARGQRNVYFPCLADHEQDWQPYPVDPYSAICDDHTYIHTYSSTDSSTVL